MSEVPYKRAVVRPERRGREARRVARAARNTDAAAFLTRRLQPYEIVSDEGMELMEHHADTILERVGVEIREPPSAIERFRAAGM